ncbi:hypothetical protein LCGC14_2386170 [marine sediment metagenome]|uniref:Uncharacterized protein n=1 Tax=marine sediment metagenome TaxID=412755 RepID=A0A0F9EU65_9ZZZZ
MAHNGQGPIIDKAKEFRARMVGIVEQGKRLMEKLDRLCISCGWCHDNAVQTVEWIPIRLSCMAAWFQRLRMRRCQHGGLG